MRNPIQNRRLSLATKFNFLTIASILVTAAGISSFLIRDEIAYSYQELLDNARSLAIMVSQNMEYGVYTEDKLALQQVANTVFTDDSVAYLTVFNREKRVLLFKTSNPFVDVPAALQDKRLELPRQTVHREFENAQDGHSYMDMWVPVVSLAKQDPSGNSSAKLESRQRQIIGYLQLGMNQDGLRHRVKEFFLSTALFTSFMVSVAVVLTPLIARRFTSPIQRLRMAAQDISEGKFDHQIDVHTNDEVSDLARSFQHMLSRLKDYRIQVDERTGDLVTTNQKMQQEIAERKQAEEALRASEEQYRELIRNANDIIYTLDLQGNFTSLNKAAEERTGYAEDEARRMNLYQIVGPEYQQTARKMIEAALRGEACTTYEVEVSAKDKRRVALEVSSRSITKDGRPVGVQGIARDVSERKHLEDQLRQSQKMEAVGQLAGGVAHDFNNLLTIISGYGQLMARSLNHDQALVQKLNIMLDAVERATRLTQQLLAFSRKQVLQPIVVEFNSIVTGIEKMLRRLIGEDISLATSLDPEAGKVKVDPSQIEQVILNLAVNSRDAMPQGGQLTIETANVEVDETYAHLHPGVRLGSYVVMAVSDTGHGMDAEIQKRIFEPFFTTKEKGKGTGLGLATVYGIVKQSGGNVYVYSEPGHGTTFKIYLPRADEQTKLDDQGDDDSFKALQGTETILVVEDEAGIRNLIHEMLDACGFKVLQASHGAEALMVAKSYKGPIDLLLTDVIMPQMSGGKLAEYLKRQRPEMQVLFMSGYTDDAVVRHGILHSEVTFLHKPFTLHDLEQKVRQLLDSAKNPTECVVH